MDQRRTSRNARKSAAIKVGDGRTAVTLEARRRRGDLYVHISGGDDHIGAAALAGVRPDGRLYAECLRIAPHREGDLALRAAKTLHSHTGVNVCVTAGIHVDNVSADEIDQILRNVEQAVAELQRVLDTP